MSHEAVIELLRRPCDPTEYQRVRELWKKHSLAEDARNARFKVEDLRGGSFTVSNMGSVGGTYSTPIINHPEVAIVGVNKLAIRPVWDGTQFVPRKIMNLSSSFDHRVVDGWDAAVFVQRIKSLLETPALIFMDE